MKETRAGTRSDQRRAETAPAISYRAVVLPCGDLLPIEARLGRRVLRTIDPGSAEGRRLLAAERVELVASQEG